jgi:hypothetical protein
MSKIREKTAYLGIVTEVILAKNDSGGDAVIVAGNLRQSVVLIVLHALEFAIEEGALCSLYFMPWNLLLKNFSASSASRKPPTQ